MARAKRPATIITNTHEGTCLVCGGKIIPLVHGAYVRLDGKGATHSSADQCTPNNGG